MFQLGNRLWHYRQLIQAAARAFVGKFSVAADRATHSHLQAA
jgi:hypothetical protein